MNPLEKWQLICGIFLCTTIIFSVVFGYMYSISKNRCSQFTQNGVGELTCSSNICANFCGVKTPSVNFASTN
jgi:hypothetical protein